MKNDGKNIFAERLRYARDQLRGWTQARLGEETGLPSTSISHFENPESTRKPSFENLRRLAMALDVTTDYLLGRSEDPMGASINDQLYKNVQMLTEADRQFALSMIQNLANRNDGLSKK
ncbi:helix-turn-helix domain-containing protein [Collimonas pratensis]|uniref:helix-turn-helix domain-containing protein n=1 Tax=Collimonas pratensis TaxID=279113 RepID=UPI00078042ED|nr:helix-turn-helix transcriptional regulator [Collimonas pratensis]